MKFIPFLRHWLPIKSKDTALLQKNPLVSEFVQFVMLDTSNLQVKINFFDCLVIHFVARCRDFDCLSSAAGKF